jgi:hypothetical protein
MMFRIHIAIDKKSMLMLQSIYFRVRGGSAPNEQTARPPRKYAHRRLQGDLR